MFWHWQVRFLQHLCHCITKLFLALLASNLFPDGWGLVMLRLIWGGDSRAWTPNLCFFPFFRAFDLPSLKSGIFWSEFAGFQMLILWCIFLALGCSWYYSDYSGQILENRCSCCSVKSEQGRSSACERTFSVCFTLCFFTVNLLPFLCFFSWLRFFFSSPLPLASLVSCFVFAFSLSLSNCSRLCATVTLLPLFTSPFPAALADRRLQLCRIFHVMNGLSSLRACLCSEVISFCTLGGIFWSEFAGFQMLILWCIFLALGCSWYYSDYSGQILENRCSCCSVKSEQGRSSACERTCVNLWRNTVFPTSFRSTLLGLFFEARASMLHSLKEEQRRRNVPFSKIVTFLKECYVGSRGWAALRKRTIFFTRTAHRKSMQPFPVHTIV